jgi:hypothetical protein
MRSPLSSVLRDCSSWTPSASDGGSGTVTPGIPAAAAARLASAARFSRSLFTGADFESPYVSRVTSSALEGSWAIPPCFTTLPRLAVFAMSVVLMFGSHLLNYAVAAPRRCVLRVRAAFRAASRRRPGPLVRTAFRADALRADADRRCAALLA